MIESIDRAAARASAAAAPAVLAAWTAAFFWLLGGGKYQAFLQPKLEPLVAAGAVLSGILALAALHSVLRRRGTAAAPRGGVAGVVLMLIPIAFLWTVYGESLGQHALSKRAVVIGREQVAAPPAPVPAGEGPEKAPAPASAREVTLSDLTDRASDFLGSAVVLEGMISKSGGLPEDWILLFRFRIVCCAADAQPLGVMVRGRGLFDKLQEDSWVRISGRFEMLDFDGEATPAVSATAAEGIPPPPPEKRYLFK
jgi:putative membrane protein